MQPALFAETMEGPTVQWMRRLAETKKSIITGSVIIEENGNYYNRLIWMLPNGQLGYYDKRHLFAFAGEHEFYSEGNKRLIASVKGWKINLQICFDLRFPVWARQQLANTSEKADEENVNVPEHLHFPHLPFHLCLLIVGGPKLENANQNKFVN